MIVFNYFIIYNNINWNLSLGGKKVMRVWKETHEGWERKSWGGGKETYMATGKTLKFWV